MKIAITGANGHIGANLCRQLLEKGHRINALLYKDNRALKGLDLRLIKGDVMDTATLAELVKGCEIVMHLAAVISIGTKASDKQLIVNTNGTKNIIHACKKEGVRRLIHFSSIHAFEQRPLFDKLDESRKGVSEKGFNYDKSKYQSEQDVIKASKDGLDCVILNPTAVLGPFDFKPSLLGQSLLRLKNGALPALVPGGFDWVDVRDLASAAISAMHHGRMGEKYLIGGTYKSLKELVELISQITPIILPRINCSYPFALLGLPLFSLFSRLNKKEPLYTRMSLDTLKFSNHFVSHEKAEKELKYHSRPLEDTIRDSYAWFKEYGYYEAD